jgi:hypothetical protein
MISPGSLNRFAPGDSVGSTARLIAAALLLGCGSDTPQPFAGATGDDAASGALATNASDLGAVDRDPSHIASPQCKQCGIELHHLVTLGSAGDAEFIARGAVPARDSKGRYFVPAGARSVGEGARLVAVFDSAGRFLRVVGKAGGGPSEFACRINYVLVAVGDSLHTFGPCQHLVFDSTFAFVRSTKGPGAVDGRPHILRDGGLVVHDNISTPALAGLPLHKLSADAEPERSFGSTTAELIPGCPSCFKRITALAADSVSVWSAPTHRYELQRWRFDGTLADSLYHPGSAWFREWTPTPFGHRGGGVGPVSSLPNVFTTIEQLWAVGDSLVFVVGITPDPTAPGLPAAESRSPPGRGTFGEVAYESLPPAGFFPSRATVIDAFHVRRKQVVATATWPGTRISLMADGLAFTHREDADGRVLIDVWRVAVTLRE